MIYTPETKRALRLCYEAHQGQTDRSGLPYVFHPFHLAEQMKDVRSTAVALLHDVVEDTAYTLDDLRERGFSPETVEAVALLTHGPDMPYLEYVSRIRRSGNAAAMAVKRADLRHNSDASRLDEVTPRDERRFLKYKMAKTVLTADEDYDIVRDCWRKRLPLNRRRTYFLSVYYTEKGVRGYSVDVEEASVVRYEFGAKTAARLCSLLPAAESLPEALAIFFETRAECNFVALMKENEIGYRAIHLD